jgi:endonuclease YncB( thermonuclease family)
MRFLIVLFCLIYFCGNSQTITKVIDGDTYIIDYKQRIRLASCDSPELNQSFGREAKKYVERLILYKKVGLKIIKTDKYGRSIAKVYINGRSLSEILIENGIAWHYSYFDSSFYLAQKEKTARKNKLGLWKYLNPINPYKFRKYGKN